MPSMNLLPDWAPNIHPLIVHFPIGLLLMAAVVDGAALILRCNRSLRMVATVAYVGGTLTLIAAYFSGRSAAEIIWLPGMAHAAIRDHWDMGLRALWFFVILTAIRLVLLAWFRSPRPIVVGALVIAGAVGVILIGQTAERGGRLVYELGVGVLQR